jgi:hypothetical protein
VQLFKDYIFDPTNPLDYALAFVPGTKPAISAGKAAAGAAKAAKVAPKKSVTGDEVLSKIKQQFQANNPGQMPVMLDGIKEASDTVVSQYSKVWDKMSSATKKALRKSDSAAFNNGFKNKEDFLNYIRNNGGVGFDSKAPNSLGDIKKIDTLINKEYAKTILNLDPKKGTVEFYRNTTGNKAGLDDAMGYYSLDRLMANSFHPGKVPGSMYPDGSRVSAKVRMDQFRGLLGVSKITDEFAATINPKLIDPKNFKNLGPKRPPKMPSYYDKANVNYSGGLSPWRNFSLVNQLKTRTVDNFQGLSLKEFLSKSGKTVEDFKSIYYKKYPLKEGQEGLYKSDFDNIKELFSADFNNPSKVGLNVSKLDRANLSPQRKRKYLQFIDAMQETTQDRIFNIRGIPNFAMGGMVKPQYFANGGTVKGYAQGGDVVPSMLTPGEFVLRRAAVDKIGLDNLNALNSGTAFSSPRSFSESNFGVDATNITAISSPQTQTVNSSSVYNYNLSVNVASMSDPNAIAQTVMGQIRQIDSQRLRGNRF